MATHVITGAGSGIGAVIAARLRDRGDALVLVARSEARAATMRHEFPNAMFLVADLAAPEALSEALALTDLPEACDSLIHAAGVVDLGAVEQLTTEAWRSQLTVNVIAPAELTRLLLPRLRTARGHVVCVNSGAGLRTSPGWSAYAASKHALKAFADGLRAEEEPNGLRVTSVYPGRTATPMQRRVHEQEGQAYDPAQFIAAESVATAVLAALDLPRDAHLVDVMIRYGGPRKSA